jgi:energy-coupling factor transport system permease protein
VLTADRVQDAPRRPRSPALARALHPVAWWLWALGLAAAASRTTNPLLLLLIVAVAGYVVVSRRTDAPWARAFKAYLVLGLVVVAVRVLFRVLLGDSTDGRVLFSLPQVGLPAWAAGIELGGRSRRWTCCPPSTTGCAWPR